MDSRSVVNKMKEINTLNKIPLDSVSAVTYTINSHAQADRIK